MQQGIEHFQKELSGVRTGRANPGLLENIMVEAAGDKLPIRACGTVTVRNPQTLAVSVYDTEVRMSMQQKYNILCLSGLHWTSWLRHCELISSALSLSC